MRPPPAVPLTRLAAVALVLAGTALAACSSAANSSTSASSTTTASPVTSAPPATSAPVTAPATSVPATTLPASTSSTSTSTSTTVAATTTTVAAPTAFLRLGGAGTASFGDPITTALPVLTKRLGTPASDDSRDYPTIQADGSYLTADGEFSFVAPKGREVCWRIGFCADFGGSSDGTIALTGWSYGSDTAKTLRSRSGVSIGTRWSEAPRISLGGPVCNALAPATVDGITLQVESKGAPLDKNPHHEDVSVVTMTAGDVPQFQFSDC